MTNYQYKTVAAPRRAPRVKGVKGKDAQAAHAIEDVLKEEAVGGWEYVRTDSFPFDDAGGLFSGRQTVTRAIMVFRRAMAPPAAAPVAAPASQVQPEPIRPASPAAAAEQPPAIGGVERD